MPANLRYTGPMTKPQPFTRHDRLRLSKHFKWTVESKGFKASDILSALRNPDKITEVRRYPGQWRYCGAGVAVVVAFDREVPEVITIYADGIVTPLRPDQMSDPAAINSKRLAERY